MLKTCQPHRLPERKAGTSSACGRLVHPGRGHRPCRSATLILDQPGAKAPGQRPPRPWRALRPRRARRWPELCPDLPVCGAPSRAGGGNAAFPGSSRTGGGTFTAAVAGAIAPALRCACSAPAGGQSPRPASTPHPEGTRHAPGGHWPAHACGTGPFAVVAPDRAGNAPRSGVRPARQSVSVGQGRFSCPAACPACIFRSLS